MWRTSLSSIAGATNKDHWFVGDHYCFNCRACNKITCRDNKQASINIENKAQERWEDSRQNLRSSIIPASYKQGSRKIDEPVPSYRTKALISSFDDAPTRRLENERSGLDFTWKTQYTDYINNVDSIEGIDQVETDKTKSTGVVKEYGSKCVLCDKFIASSSSLLPHMLQCARKQSVAQTPCPTCKWPV